MEGQAASTVGKRFFNRLYSFAAAAFPKDSGSHNGVVTTLPSSPANGITFVNLGVGGSTTATLTQAAAEALGAKNPIAVVWQAVMNDYTNGAIAPATTKTNVVQRMNWVDAMSAFPICHVFVGSFPRYDFGTPAAGKFYDDYMAKYREIVAENPARAILIDGQADFKRLGVGYGADGAPTPTTPPDPYDLMFGDGVHMDDEGLLFLAELVWSRLGFNLSGIVAAADVTAPGQPTSFAIGTCTTTTAPVSWTNGIDDVGIDHSVVSYRSPSGSGSWLTKTTAGTGSSDTITGLTAVTTIEAFVTHYDAATNPSAPSNTDTDTTAAVSGGINLWTYPGLIAVYDPELDSAVTALANGQAVASLTPSAGTELSPLAQATPANRPTVATSTYNGKRALVFNGTNSYMLTGAWATAHGPDSPAADAVTEIFFGEFTVGQPFSSQSATNYLMARKESSANDDLKLFAGSTTVSGTVTGVGDTAHVLVIKWKAGTNELKVFNHALTPTTYTMTTNAAQFLPGLKVGTNGSNSSFFLNGKMGLCAAIAGEITDSDIQAIMQQLVTYFAAASLGA